MKLFESDNMWKRRKRAQDRAARPDTPEERAKAAKEKWTGNLLWLLGAAFLLVLGLAGVKLGVVALDTITTVFLVVLGLYVLVSIGPTVQSYRAWKEAKR